LPAAAIGFDALTNTLNDTQLDPRTGRQRLRPMRGQANAQSVERATSEGRGGAISESEDALVSSDSVTGAAR